MKTAAKSLIWKNQTSKIKTFVTSHVVWIHIDNAKKNIHITVDKKYSLNELFNSWLIWNFEDLLKKVYPEDYEIHFSVKSTKKWHDREMLIPQKIKR